MTQPRPRPRPRVKNEPRSTLLNNQSILGAVFKYVDEVKRENGYSFSKLEWLQQDMYVKNVFAGIQNGEPAPALI